MGTLYLLDDKRIWVEMDGTNYGKVTNHHLLADAPVRQRLRHASSR
jgi:hypothetical protein